MDKPITFSVLLTHKHIYVHMCSMHLRRDTFLRVPRMKASEFGRPCLTNAHLAFGSKGDARSEPGMTDSMLINAGKAQEPMDS